MENDTAVNGSESDEQVEGTEPSEYGRDGVGDTSITDAVDESPAETEQPVKDYFKSLREHDSNPTVRLSEVQKIRYTEMAKDLEDARVQAYIEANFGLQALNLLQAVVPILAGLL